VLFRVCVGHSIDIAHQLILSALTGFYYGCRGVRIKERFNNLIKDLIVR